MKFFMALVAFFMVLIGVYLVMISYQVDPKVIEIFHDNRPVDVNLQKNMIGKFVKLKGAIWHFNEKDTNKIVKVYNTWRWHESMGGGVSISAVVECRKPENELLYGQLEFNFQGNEGNYKLYEIRNMNAEVVKEYK